MNEIGFIEACQRLIDACAKLDLAPVLVNRVQIGSADYSRDILPDEGSQKAMYRIEIDEMRRAACTVYKTIEIARRAHAEARQVMGDCAGIRFGPVVVQHSDDVSFRSLFELLSAIWKE
jgi:hypothetical protein